MNAKHVNHDIFVATTTNMKLFRAALEYNLPAYQRIRLGRAIRAKSVHAHPTRYGLSASIPAAEDARSIITLCEMRYLIGKFWFLVSSETTNPNQLWRGESQFTSC
jgi:hypothetical protein